MAPTITQMCPMLHYTYVLPLSFCVYFTKALVTQYLRRMFLEVLRKRGTPLEIHTHTHTHTQQVKNELFVELVRSSHSDHTVTASMI